MPSSAARPLPSKPAPEPALVLVLVLVLVCACRDSPHPTPPPSPPPSAAAPPPAPSSIPTPDLPHLERERLTYLFEAATRVAQTWPALVPNEVCLLLVGRAAQWLVQCPEAPAGFTRTGAEFRGHPVFAHAGDSFEVGGETRTTAQLLAQTPAAAHVFGKRQWLLLGTLDALRAYHPAFPPATTEHWLSVAVHELVHLHQLRQPAVAPLLARIDAGELKPEALTQRYGQDARFRAAIEREYQQLTAAAKSALQPAAARAALRRWLASYRRRSAQLAKQADGAKLAAEERLFTYLEGVARYVESDFLVNDAQHPPTGLAADREFHGFRAFAGGGYAVSPNRQLDPQYYYAIGYHLCVLLARVDPAWEQRVDAQPGWLIGLVERMQE